MRRISLAVALIGAVAAAGCGGGAKPSSSAANPGTGIATFKVKINNQGPGTVTASPAPTSGTNPCLANTTCELTYTGGTAVTLTAAATAPNYFNGWFSQCGGTGTCALTGDADKYVVAYFSANPESHPNFNDPALHGAELAKVGNAASQLKCTNCHSSTLSGVGLAVACTQCHAPAMVADFLTIIRNAPPVPSAVKQERCAECHAGEGAKHQTLNNSYLDPNTVLTATVDSVVSTPLTGPDAGKFDVKLTFSLKKNGQPFTAVINSLGQKTMYAVKYDGTRAGFNTYTSFAAASTTETATKGTYTVTATKQAFAPESSNAFVLLYFAETATVLPNKGNYKYYDNLATAGKTYGTWTWGSAVKSESCSKCHPSPYLKHGFRPGPVAGLEDMVACKACHWDNRAGHDAGFQLLATDRALFATGVDANTMPQFNYVASTMNDTHMSHAMEFAYPQSMANCVTCHEGKLDIALADGGFTLKTCKSCHPVTATTVSTGAPPLYPTVGTAPDATHKQGILPAHHDLDANGLIHGVDCNGCHSDNADAAFIASLGGTNTNDDGVGPAIFGHTEGIPLFKALHNGGFDARVYTAGAKISATKKASLTSASYAAATNTLTAQFSMSGVEATDLVKPTVVVSLYGYDTKDFLVSGHGSLPAAEGGTALLEWAEGACQRGTGGSGQPACVPATSSRLQVSPNATAGNSSWTATVDLTKWADLITAGKVKRVEIGFLPALDDKAVGGVTATIAVPDGTIVADMYGKDIVSTDKCNKCHEALAIEFHSPNYGSAGVVGCRLCHVVGTGGSHLEMQSRSIDSYVHALHSMQYMDVQNTTWDTLGTLAYAHHVESTYPKFTTLDCLSCHNPGKFEVPAQNRSLPGILSASSTLKAGYPANQAAFFALVPELTATNGLARAQFNVPTILTGPGARACGSCHRSQLINEGDAAGIAAFDSHTASWGYRVAPGSTANAYYYNAQFSTVISDLATAGLLAVP